MVLALQNHKIHLMKQTNLAAIALRKVEYRI